MAVPTAANYVFLPWVRQGAASGIQTPDRSAGQAGVVSVPVTLRINDTEDMDIARQVRLYGPGDVTGIDPQQVIRTVPRHRATDFEPNYFPAVEFDRPDFPWLFTPAKADADGKLRPWLCLVVVRKQDGVALRVDPGLPLPVLDITSPARPERELPDLSESWAWAHAQVAGTQPNAKALKTALGGDPALTASRLVCPRRLDPVTEYLACVVPAFELGRMAGLGLPITSDDEKALHPAWSLETLEDQQSPLPVTLPVYFHWEFRTGTGGDFEALAQKLVARGPDEMPGVGKRPMDISQPGFGIILPPGTMLELEGALRVKGDTSVAWPTETRTPFQAELTKILNAPRQAMQQEGNAPLLAPPIYGSWQAARHTVEIIADSTASPPSPRWLHELNLDPRHRAVAALGTKVIQDQQELLMASAWEQLGDLERINQVRRQAQLARAVNDMYHAKSFTRFSAVALLNVVAPAQSRAVVEATDGNDRPTRVLLSESIAQTALPARAVSAPLRRLTSTRGVISTRSRTAGAPPSGIVALLSTTPVVALQRKEAGWVTINQVSDTGAAGPLTEIVRFGRIAGLLATAPPLGKFQISAESGGKAIRTALNDPTFTGPAETLLPDSSEAAAFRQAAKAHQAYIEQAFPSLTPPPPSPRPSMDLSVMQNTLLQHLNPEMTLKARVEATLRRADGAPPGGDPLAPILDAPAFPQPMYEALRDLAQDFLFPGLEHVPQGTVALLATNPQFVEAFLVGLNAEMSRELLWRGYPTDQRGTYFRQFWDTPADNDPPDTDPPDTDMIRTWQPDIDMIHKWFDLPLGQNASRGDNTSEGEQLVLLIRGELLRRYPNSVIYAMQAVPGEEEKEHHPLFRGTLKPDVTFLGFDLKLADISADLDHWFFVIQQQPTEPSFGLDVANFEKPPPPETPPLMKWDDLSWRHLANTEEDLQKLSHVSIEKQQLATPPEEKGTWGRNAAHQAYITLQRPVRIAIQASQMLPPMP
jgi:hypothetical protein